MEILNIFLGTFDATFCNRKENITLNIMIVSLFMTKKDTTVSWPLLTPQLTNWLWEKFHELGNLQTSSAIFPSYNGLFINIATNNGVALIISFLRKTNENCVKCNA